ncbi:MAG: NAD(P)H-dependent glycerol-3-phosphate dehydrogenase, partial [Bdellovibrionales bacterium]|nr:NAD(P)H-dependent glycerol-3-phosphate dehydrogenase [Bdellovibrionales bacterium]
IGGIVKNVIALAVGISDGLELGDSARAALITRGLAEMMRLAIAMGAEQQTLAGLSGLGDLVMTATYDTSRNRTVGLRLGKGESLENILNTLGSTAEAVKTTPLVLQLANEHQVEMPITEGTAALLSGEVTADEMIQRFITRPMKPEF